MDHAALDVSRRRGRTGRIALALFAPLVVVGPAAGLAAASTPAHATKHVATTTVTIGEPLSPPEGPQQAVFIARDLGYFAREHLDVKIAYMPNGLQSELGTTANSITIGMAGGSDSIEAAAQGAPIHAVWVTYQKLDLQCIAGPKITSIKDLVGQNVGSTGAGGFSQTTMNACLTAGGVNPSQVHEITMTRAEFVPALASGRIEAAVFHADDAYTVLHEIKGAHVLDDEYKTLPNYWYGSLNVRDSYAKTHALVVEHAIAALMMADRWMSDPKNNAKFVQLAMNDTSESRGAVQTAINFDRSIGLWNTSCAVSPASIAFTSHLLLQQKSITQVPSFSQVYNGTYCKAAAKLVG
jgi:ABC-type nitrate/sulfonate/bicarbonate transport system substrate-binding protein